MITGANGYLGARCVERCVGTPDREVVAVWHAGTNRMAADPPPHVHYVRCDLTDRAEVEALFEQWPSAMVVHTAALRPDEGPDYLHRAVLSNIATTANLLDHAGASCTRFVYCSSISVYEALPSVERGWTEDGGDVRPPSIYGWTKYAGEECVRLRSEAGGVTGVSLRLAGIHGPGRRGGVVYHMMRAALAGRPLKVSNPTNPLQMLFLDDAVDGIFLSLTAPLRDAYQRVNLASHTFPSSRHLAAGIVEYCRSGSPLEPGAVQPPANQVMNLDRMTTVLGLAPRSREWSLRQIREWLEVDG